MACLEKTANKVLLLAACAHFKPRTAGQRQRSTSRATSLTRRSIRRAAHLSFKDYHLRDVGACSVQKPVSGSQGCFRGCVGCRDDLSYVAVIGREWQRINKTGDVRVLSEANKQIRSKFRENAGLSASDPAVQPAIQHAKEVASFLRQNVVQGKKEEGDVYSKNEISFPGDVF